MTTLSTHVLDAAEGRPAAGLDVVLTAGDGTFLAAATTDADGRVAWSADLDPGSHTLTFATGEWFGAADRTTFFPVVTLPVALDGDHAHVALLLSPFSYTAYRGS
ncbi:hydroxyisourate hydrolase [Aeromicrobium wangtongii]|uniref:5-hydroxyisourate hydrolase n=1 Tax=Aeromicrobium wangtongii TaxID=2969247 RepID=A0ABY5MB48_9ACTN|nr:hydroxyisourate hydrolase [Aeromicrobium wangtongii]MCD9196837.1 hydroxyisourate hydrolase [Aeromicrobium wangtongii]UUP14346.1 hydroxyisourate hydrolase [Aeromicrobium wangtongii]